MSFVFYDTETTGTHEAFDQILQFAAIRTDPDLNECERFEIRSRVSAHVVPAPGAMRANGLRPARLVDQSLPSHYEMMCAIRRKMVEWSPSLFLGYNSVQFDERFLRHSYYRTLHPPYLTNTSGNSRSDVMRAAQASSLFAPGKITVPTKDSKLTFKLEHLALANGFEDHNAHDALGDVEATIHVAKLISERCPDVWSSFMRFSTKAAVQDFVASEELFCLADFYFGRPYAWLVTPLRAELTDPRDLYVFDLGVDPDSLASLSDDRLKTYLAKSPKPVRRILSNGAPMIFAAEDAPDSASGKRIPQEELNRRIRALAPDSELVARICVVLEELDEPKPVSPHVEEQLYQGFYSPADTLVLERFHEIGWDQRLALLDQLEDPRLKILGQLLIHAERPETLDEAVRREHDSAIAKRIAHEDSSGPWLTLPKALAEIDKVLAAETEDREFWMEHREYISERLRGCQAFL